MSSFWFVIKQKLITNEISIFSNNSHLKWRVGLSDTILKRDHPSQICFNLVQRFQRRRFKCDSLRRTTDAKWWQKLTWPLARWAKNCFYNEITLLICALNDHKNFRNYNINMEVLYFLGYWIYMDHRSSS